MTGITRFARNHLFSAANNIIDISDEPAYGALCGFTEEEVDRHFAPAPEAPRVYNPFTLTSGAGSVLRDVIQRRAAADGAWSSAWSRSGPGPDHAPGQRPAPAPAHVRLVRCPVAATAQRTG